MAIAIPVAAETVIVTNAHILTMGPAGEISSGAIVMTDGRIGAVGERVALPEHARVVNAQGRTVTPGLIAVDTNLTITEVDGVPQTDDSATRSRRISAAYDVQYAVNPASPLTAAARLTGVTRAVVTPGYEEGGDRELAFAGLGAIVQLGSGDPIQKGKAVMVIDLGEAGAAHTGGGRPSTIVALKEALIEARAYSGDRRGYERGASRPFDLSRADLDALVPVAEGRTPLLVRVHRAIDIQRVLKVADEERLRLILQGAEEGWMVAADIAAARVPVIVDPLANLPTSFDMLGAASENAALLRAAGVELLIQGARDWGLPRQARFNAGTAVAYGLPYLDAMAALTINPARAFGVDASIGSIAPGKDADLVIWDGDPLEVTSAPVAVYVKGNEQSLRSRSIELRDRYLQRDPAYPAAYFREQP